MGGGGPVGESKTLAGAMHSPSLWQARGSRQLPTANYFASMWVLPRVSANLLVSCLLLAVVRSKMPCLIQLELLWKDGSADLATSLAGGQLSSWLNQAIGGLLIHFVSRNFLISLFNPGKLGESPKEPPIKASSNQYGLENSISNNALESTMSLLLTFPFFSRCR